MREASARYEGRALCVCGSKQPQQEAWEEDRKTEPERPTLCQTKEEKYGFAS
jgi:hypothetical protein